MYHREKTIREMSAEELFQAAQATEQPRYRKSHIQMPKVKADVVPSLIHAKVEWEMLWKASDKP